jgi:hypothetical protein
MSQRTYLPYIGMRALKRNKKFTIKIAVDCYDGTPQSSDDFYDKLPKKTRNVVANRNLKTDLCNISE